MPDFDEEDLRKIKAWKRSPKLFARQALRQDPEPWQDEVFDAVTVYDQVAMIACVGPGKTAELAGIGWWWLSTRWRAQIACISQSFTSLQDGLWKELEVWYEQSPFLQKYFRFGKRRIVNRLHPGIWFASARGWKQGADKTAVAHALKGLHGPAMMVLGDEAGTYPAGVLPAAKGIRANVQEGQEAKIVLAGNPDPGGPLYQIATTEADQWYRKHITGDPDDPKRARRVSIDWARGEIKAYGRDNPWVLVGVFGEFPPVGFNQLLGPDQVRIAMERQPRPERWQFSQRRIGIDVARFGDDRTVLFPRQGVMSWKPIVLRKQDSHEVAARVALAKANFGSEMELIDNSGGWAAGTTDALRQAQINVIPVNSSGDATDPRYFNKRSEMWWNMAKAVREGLALPNDMGLQRELTAPQYSMQAGRLRVEEKEQIKKRLGFSPDMADALVYTYAIVDMPRSMMSQVDALARERGVDTRGIRKAIDRSQGKQSWDYNPLERR